MKFYAYKEHGAVHVGYGRKGKKFIAEFEKKCRHKENLTYY